MPQDLMKNEPSFLVKPEEDQSWIKYLAAVEAVLDDYYLSTNRNPLEPERWTKTIKTWANHLNKARIPRIKLLEVYERSLRKTDFITVPTMLNTWAEMQEQAVNSVRISGRACEICHGRGEAMMYNFDTGEDELKKCICRMGE